ncbi:MAG: protein kinase [Planctomycetes bacterium]|nr:protein kinase [Planctomycetota bacterium]
MPPAPAADSGTYRPYTKLAGTEPLPGYKLLSPLGRGGFGEVWRCEAPGGLQKAIKFVTSESEDGRGDERLGQELAAFEQIKAIRHPFLLTLERVEQVGAELVMVMELADRQLQDRFRECCNCGLPGIPRDELLAYFADAAEALDVIGAKYGLQHLDVKPANLFLVSGHVKVGDYGLVAQLEGPDAGNRGLTPRYVAPEVLHGTPSGSSDQYSLALVYCELLTSVFPYTGRTPQQLMLQHVSGQPSLSALPPADQPAVAKALAKKPENRFASCLAFVQALMASGADTALPNASMNLRRARVDRSVAEMNLSTGDDSPAGSSLSGRADPTHLGQPRGPEPTQSFTLPGKPNLTVPGRTAGTLPPLVSGNRRPAAQPSRPTGPSGRVPAPGARTSGTVSGPPRRGADHFPAPAADDRDGPLAEEVEAGQVVLEHIGSVMPVAALFGMTASEPPPDPQTFAAAVVQAAAAGGHIPQMPGDVGRLADGTWVCEFPSTVPAPVVPLKLSVVRDQWGASIEQPDPAHLVMRRTAGGGGLFGGKKYGYEISVLLPTGGKPVGEVTVLGRTFGAADPKFAREAQDLLPKVLLDVRTQLGNVQDRRRHPRVACGLGLTLYPLHSDGAVDAAVPVRCHDVSLGGVGFATATALQTKYAYAAFAGVPTTAGQAILLRLIRVQNAGGERLYGAQYRTDL